eukprot:COSAG04_NODE_21517_length_372_cov_0.831502_1_plen_20_part_01
MRMMSSFVGSDRGGLDQAGT